MPTDLPASDDGPWPDGRDEAHTRWHALDHLPEQVPHQRSPTWHAAVVDPTLPGGAVTPLLAAPFVPVRLFAWDAALLADTEGASP